MASILTFWPPRSGVRARILFGASYELATAVTQLAIAQRHFSIFHDFWAGRKSLIFKVRVAPRALETLQKGRGLRHLGREQPIHPALLVRAVSDESVVHQHRTLAFS